MKRLVPSYADPDKWRSISERYTLADKEWKALRLKILRRDNYTCQYCGYRSEKFQIIDHIDGDPQNNDESNLQTICQMCNLIKHVGQGCVVKGVVDLYKESKYNQVDIIRITRKMRDKGKSDEEIISFLGLKHKMPFKMNRNYLRKLYGFVTSRSTRTGNDMYDRWKSYHASIVQKMRVQDKM
jgi:hypothetical protein